MTTTSPLPSGLPRPGPTPIDAPFWEGLRAHRLVLPRCDACGTWRAPEVVCFRCHSFESSWTEVEPEATIYSWERVWHPVHPALETAVPYVVVVVTLTNADGVRLVGNLLGDPRADVHIGSPVRGVFDDHDEGFTLLQWERA